MKKRERKEMTIIEKVVLIAICIATAAFLLRMWDPAFFHWFHMKPMQEVSFLRNIWQTLWLSFQIIVYIVWSAAVLWMMANLIYGAFALIIGTITGIIDILIAVWNLITWVTPLPHVEMSITRVTFEYIGDILDSDFSDKLLDAFPVLFSILVISTVIALPLLMTLF